jgi:hypothetical protein
VLLITFFALRAQQRAFIQEHYLMRAVRLYNNKQTSGAFPLRLRFNAFAWAHFTLDCCDTWSNLLPWTQPLLIRHISSIAHCAGDFLQVWIYFLLSKGLLNKPGLLCSGNNYLGILGLDRNLFLYPLSFSELGVDPALNVTGCFH